MLRYIIVVMIFSFFSFANHPTHFNIQANNQNNDLDYTIDPLGNTITNSYDSNSNLLSTTDAPSSVLALYL